MKKALVLSLMCVLALGFSAMSTTTADFTAGGFGSAALVFTPGNDAIVTFSVGGNGYTATGQASDADDNLYYYNVDSITGWLRFTTTNGGDAYLKMQRTDSYVPMYGPAGQVSYWEVYSSDGTASLNARESMNYADNIASQYGFQANAQLQAAGTQFFVLRQITNGADWAAAQIIGNGSGILTNMNSGADGTGFTLEGWTGCYKNDSMTMSGEGTTFIVQAFSQHTMSWENGTSTGATNYLFEVDQAGGTTTINNWWVAGS